MDLYENLTETVPGTLESRFKSFSDAVKSVGVENGGGEGWIHSTSYSLWTDKKVAMVMST